MYFVQPPYLLRQFYSQLIWRFPFQKNTIFLTFDDGPVPEITPAVLDILKKENVKATFFCVGENVQKYPNLFQQILAENHAVGNHTFNHVNGWKTNSDDYFNNIKKCADIVPSNLFRPPYGKIKKSQCKHIQTDYSIIMWDVLSGDYNPNISPEKCLKNTIQHTRSGSIILFHDSVKAEKNMLYALPRFIEDCKRKNYFFETISPLQKQV
ncbi:MAG: polysaccharide deacetylase family protein [Bacteroidia bacterium]